MKVYTLWKIMMKKIGFIGMGNMASAILNGMIKAEFLSGDSICAYDISLDQLKKVESLGIEFAKNEQEVVEKSEIIFIAVKPQVIENVLLPLKEKLKGKAIISIVLGYDFKKYEEIVDGSTRHIFVMPNTPVQVLEGMCLLEETHSLNKDEFEFTKKLFESIGRVEIVPSHLMGVAGALCGCSPAFIYMVIEALADGAVKEGMPRAMAYRLASQMILGSGKMQLETNIHPAILKDNVCSPGGSTIQGVKVLEDGKMRSLFIEAISKSTNYK